MIGRPTMTGGSDDGRITVERELSWAACWNVRELGGHPTRSGGRTRWRSVVRAGNLSKLTAAGRDAMIAYGIRTVVDLRDPREFAIDMDPFHERGIWAGQLQYVNEPLVSEIEWQALQRTELQQRGYVLTLELSTKNIRRVMSAIAAAPPGGVVIHCHAGKDRTGVIAALLLALAEVPDEIIEEDYVASDRHLEPLYEAWAAREGDPERRSRLLHGFRCRAEHIRNALAYVDGRGGTPAYLRDAGLTTAELDRLRQRIGGSD